jgi:hypothetical protein
MSISIYVDTPFKPTSQDMGFFMKFFPLLDSVPIPLVAIRTLIRTLIKLTAPKFRALAATAAILLQTLTSKCSWLFLVDFSRSISPSSTQT